MDSLAIIKDIIIPIVTGLTASFALLILSSTYFIVFRMRKYIKRSNAFLEYTRKLHLSFNDLDVNLAHLHCDDMYGIQLENNKKLINDLLLKYKNADLKDIIMGIYNNELKSIKDLININHVTIKNNKNFLKFQRLFHVYTKDTVRLLYLNNDYVSFYKMKRRYVQIGIIKKDIIEKLDDKFFQENLFQKYDSELKEYSSVYNIYFYKKFYTYKNVINPNSELEDKLDDMKTIFRNVIKKRNSIYNIYLKNNFQSFLDKKENQDLYYRTDDDFIYVNSNKFKWITIKDADNDKQEYNQVVKQMRKYNTNKKLKNKSFSANKKDKDL